MQNIDQNVHPPQPPRTNWLALINRLLIIGIAFIFLTVILLRYSSLADGVASTISILVTLVLSQFPGLRIAHEHPWLENKRLTIVLIPILILVAWLLYSTTTFATPGNPIIPMAVDATKQWQDTGVIVKSGEQVTVQVVGGTWTNWRHLVPEASWNQIPEDIKGKPVEEIWINRMKESNGSGSLTFCKDDNIPPTGCPIQNYNNAALIAQIGNTRYGIGPSCSFTATDNGVLQLMINDARVDDNAGMLAVIVTVGQNITNIDAQPCGKPVT